MRIVKSTQKHVKEIIKAIEDSPRNHSMDTNVIISTEFLSALDKNNKLIGFIGVKKHSKELSELGFLFVFPDNRKTGVATALIREALKSIKSIAFAYTIPSNKASIKTFTKLNFVNTKLGSKVLLLKWNLEKSWSSRNTLSNLNL